MQGHTMAEFAFGVVRLSRTPFGYHVWSDFEPTASTTAYSFGDAWELAKELEKNVPEWFVQRHLENRTVV